jgi:transposase
VEQDDEVSDPVIEPAGVGAKRVRRTAEEKRRIVEATLVPGTSIARVAREHGVNANQVFQWRYEYRKGTLGLGQRSHPGLMPVKLTAEQNTALKPDQGSVFSPSGAIHIDLRARASIRVEAGADPELVRIVLGSLVR